MELESRHLRAICTIADTGSLSKAAARLGVSQPSLTAQLHRIEAVMGGELFTRGRKGTEPTELGRFVIGRARSVLAELESLAASSPPPEEQASPPARVRVGGVPGHTMIGLVLRLREVVPDAEVVAEVNPSSRLAVQLAATDRLDVAVVDEFDTAPLTYPEGVGHRTLVEREPLSVALPADHPAAQQDAVKLIDLANENWIVDPSDWNESGELPLLRAACAAVGFVPILKHFTGDSTVARELVCGGQGIGLFLPLAREVPGMVLRPIAGDPVTRRLIMVWRRRFASPAFVDQVYRAAAEAYVAGVESGHPYERWWQAHPEVHPRLD